MSYQESFYPESRFGGFTDVDGTIVFFTRVNALIEPHFHVLDVGCGRGARADDPVAVRRKLVNLKGKVKKLTGIDVDPAAAVNPFIDEFRRIEGGVWPLKDRSVDLIVCDNVLEHVEDPATFFSELGRVLRGGGYVCVRTPNARGYVALAAKLVPDKHHGRVKAVVQEERNREEDVFPTRYRCNTVPKILSMMKKIRCDAVVYAYEAEPSYLSFSRVAYWLGTVHRKLAPGFFKAAIFAFGKKMDAGGVV
jgi:SAM-dependent methyltransferase